MKKTTLIGIGAKKQAASQSGQPASRSRRTVSTRPTTTNGRATREHRRVEALLGVVEREQAADLAGERVAQRRPRPPEHPGRHEVVEPQLDQREHEPDREIPRGRGRPRGAEGRGVAGTWACLSVVRVGREAHSTADDGRAAPRFSAITAARGGRLTAIPPRRAGAPRDRSAIPRRVGMEEGRHGLLPGSRGDGPARSALPGDEAAVVGAEELLQHRAGQEPGPGELLRAELVPARGGPGGPPRRRPARPAAGICPRSHLMIRAEMDGGSRAFYRAIPPGNGGGRGRSPLPPGNADQ